MMIFKQIVKQCKINQNKKKRTIELYDLLHEGLDGGSGIHYSLKI